MKSNYATGFGCNSMALLNAIGTARTYDKMNPMINNNFTCNFCQKIIKEGICRLKHHLVGGFSNIKRCPNCSEHVKEEVTNYMVKK